MSNGLSTGQICGSDRAGQDPVIVGGTTCTLFVKLLSIMVIVQISKQWDVETGGSELSVTLSYTGLFKKEKGNVNKTGILTITSSY